MKTFFFPPVFMSSGRSPSSPFLDTQDALFASPNLFQPESPVSSGRRTIAKRAKQSMSLQVDPLEERIVQTIDPIIGPLESPNALQNQIDSQNATLATLRQDFADAESELELLQGNKATVDSDSTEKTGQIGTLTTEQNARTLQITNLEQQIRDTDAHIAALQASGAPYHVNWLSDATSFGTVPGTNGKESFAVTVSPDGSLLARGDRAGNVELIDMVTGQQLFTSRQSGYVCDLAFDETGRRLASVHTSGAVMIIDTQTHAVTTRTVPTDFMYGSMQWIGDDIFVSTQGNGINVINAQTGARRSIQSPGMVNGIARVGHDEIFAAGPVGPVALYSSQGTLLAQAPSPGIALTSAASRDGSMMAVVTWDGKVTVYNQSLQVIGQATGAGNGYRLTFLGNKGLATYDVNGRLLLFTLSDMKNGQLGTPQILSTNSHQGYSNTMGVAPDGSMIFNIDPNNGIRATRMPSSFITSASAPAIATEQTTRTHLTQSLDALHTDMATAQNQWDALTQEKNDLEELSATYDGSIAEVEARLTALQGEIDNAEHSIQTLQDRLDALDAAFVDMAPDSQDLAAGLAASVQASLDAVTDTIRYAKIGFEKETVGNDTIFHIHFRNPATLSHIQVWYDQGDGFRLYRETVVSDPTADSVYDFIIPGVPDASGDSVFFRLCDGQTNATLAEIHGNYNGPIEDFSVDEPGMLAENPITPSLTVGKISGPTLLLVVQTPHDQYYIDTDMAGLLSTTNGSSEGGTTFSIAQITVDTGRNTGYHTIHLYDRQGGQLLDTVSIFFDSATRTVSLANPADQYSGSASVEDTDIAQKQQAMQALASVPIGLSDPTIANLQQLNLYYKTADLPAPYNLVFDNDRMIELLYQQPENWKFAPQNQEAAVQQIWDSGGFYNDNGVQRHATPYSQAQDSIIWGRQQLVQRYTDAMSVYEKAMAQCMQSAVNIFLGIVQGQPEQALRYTLDDLYRTWSQDGSVKMVGAIGVVFPNQWTLEMAAKQVFETDWQYLVQSEEDVQQVQERADYLRSQGMRQTAEGDWVTATKGTLGAPPAELNTDELRLATKIGIAMGQSTQLFAKYTPEQRAAIVSIAAILLGKNPSDTDIAQKISIAMNTVDTQMNPVANSETGGLIVTADQQTASDKVGAIGQRTLYNQVLGWFDTSMGSLRQPFPIRTDSVVGKIIYAGAESLWRATSEEARWEVAFSLQRLTDISAQNFMDQFTQAHDSVNTFASNMTALLTQGQYGELFTVHQYFENPMFAGAYPDIPTGNGSYNGNTPVRIRFDIVPVGKSVQRIDAISAGNIIATSAGSTFIKFNPMQLDQFGNNLRVTLRATFTDGTTIEIESDPFDVHPDVTTGPNGFNQILSGVPDSMKTAVSEALNVDLNNLPAGNIALLQHFMDAFLKNGALHFDTDALGQAFELEGDMYGTKDDQCKAWLQKFLTYSIGITIPNNIAKDAHDNPIISYEWVMNPPDANGLILSADGKTEQVASIRGNATFESMISSDTVKDGDIIQMAYGSTPHTMALWKKEATGIWVFDTNFGKYGKSMPPDGIHQLTGSLDVNGNYYPITDAQVAAGSIRTQWYQSDDTVRLHFLSYADLNSKATYATAYRVQ